MESTSFEEPSGGVRGSQAGQADQAGRGAAEIVRTRCCVVGGGPAGMMLGLLLSRAGIDTVVLEKHGDFLRDFRGDTIHPSTLQVLDELGLLEAFLELPHQKVYEFQVQTADGEMANVADFGSLHTRSPFIAFIPQWDFLDFIAGRARSSPAFHLRMRTEATDLLTHEGRVGGVRAQSPEGDVEVHADLVVACDGRGSVLRDRAGLPVRTKGSPIDVLWFRLPRRPDDPGQAGGRLARGLVVVLLNRTDAWQCGYVIPKGAAEDVRKRGLEPLRHEVAEIAPFLADRVQEVRSWDQVPLLSVRVDHLRRWWRPGLLCIGDAAHAMSPVGGVGINLAIQDAVATANALASPLLRHTLEPRDLQRVQRRRMWPTRATQRIQLLLQDRLLAPSLRGAVDPRLPLPIKVLARFPILQRAAGRLVGMGFRPEHVRTPVASLPPAPAPTAGSPV
jgi:2-polyprenyl-6-methoxyphenol hydroxylase-like FAD-dependent oxidoreductase